MKNHISGSTDKYPTESKLVMIILAITGLLFIAISLLITEEGSWGYLHELIKELGIVILAVFTVSLLYELTIAKKYLNNFLNHLRQQIEQGESNGATCANLGILKIFTSRDKYEAEYPFSTITSNLSNDSRLRIIAISLFLLIGGAFPLPVMKTCLLQKFWKKGRKKPAWLISS